ncbi:MAG: hypothetical protein JOZ85_07125 [Betaproteobacteria bacterium]|nr:hypothetical protein [Betaproteobacteria bacterium]
MASMLAAGIVDMRVFPSASIIDSSGKVVYSTNSVRGFDVSDRDYFRFHATTAGDELRIGTPTTGRVMGRAVMHVTRRVSGPNGEFRGVVMIAVTPEYLHSPRTLISAPAGRCCSSERTASCALVVRQSASASAKTTKRAPCWTIRVRRLRGATDHSAGLTEWSGS